MRLSSVKHLLLSLSVTFIALSPSWADDGKKRAASAKLKSGIDIDNFSADVPAHRDFYQHVNGRWLQRTEIPADKSNYGSFSVLVDDAELALRKIVEQIAESPGKALDSDEQKVGDLYECYMDVDRLNTLGLAPLADELQRVNAISSKGELAKWMARSVRLGFGNAFVPYVSPDAKDSEKYTVYLSQSGTNLPDRDYYLKDDGRMKGIRQAYVKYIAAILKAARFPDPEGAATRILALETRMAKAQWTRVQNRDPGKTYNRRSSQEVAEQLAHFDWATFAQAAQLAGQAEFVVRQPSYLSGFDEIFASTPLETWKEYFAFRVLDAYAWALSQEYEQLHFDFHDRTLSGVAEPGERWKRGIKTLNGTLGEILGKLYVEAHFSSEAKEEMSALVENLKTAFSRRIDQLDWMSQGTKIRAREKLEKFTTKIGYPDKWKDYSELHIRPNDLMGNLLRSHAFEYDRDIKKLGGPIDRSEWHMTPQTVNAYYNPLMNEIVFPAAILQPPFFDLEADPAVNYGAIGAVIGHELSHGFDDKGSKFDGDGNLRNWWTRGDREEFEKRAKQLVQQYAEYSPIEKLHLNGELTLGENIGDLGGLNVAYTAYQLALGKDQPPVIDGLTGAQRFFLGWGQIWRRKSRDQELRRRLLVDPHSPSRYRSNGVVSNMDEFYKAFDVKPGQAMFIAPEKRVRIW